MRPPYPKPNYRAFEPSTAREIARQQKVPKSEWARLGIPPAPFYDGWYDRIVTALLILIGITVVLLFVLLAAYHYCAAWGSICSLGRVR